jgi:hypothetical protein
MGSYVRDRISTGNEARSRVEERFVLSAPRIHAHVPFNAFNVYQTKPVVTGLSLPHLGYSTGSRKSVETRL